jgi:PAS domain S-box-containing protein
MDEKPICRELEERNQQLEQAIQKSEEKFRILLDESSDPIFSFYPDGTYHFVNQAFAEGVGKSVDEIVGHRIWDIFPGEEGDKRFSAVEHVFATGKTKTIEVRVPRPDGDTYYITTAKAAKDRHGKVIFVTCSSKDITDRKQAEETLRESEERHRLFFENSPIGIIHYSSKGIITAVNKAMVTTFGSSREALIGLDINGLPNKIFSREIYKSLNGTSGYFEGEYTSYTGKKTSYIKAIWIPIKKDGEILAGVGIVEDITERKTTEEALRLSEGKLSAMLDSLTDPVSMMDRDLNILWANDTAIRLFGEDLIGKKCYQVYHGKDKTCDPYPCITLKAFENDRTYTHETQVIGKDGQSLYFHCTANVALRDENGNPTAVIEISRDITDRKRAEEALNSEKEHLAVTLRSIGDAVISTDSSGRVTLMNPIAENLTGWPESEAKGRPMSEVFTIVNELDGRSCPNPVQLVLETGKNRGESTHTMLISRDGKKYHIADSAAPIMDAGKMIAGVVLVFRDITAARRTEAELLKMEKLRSLGVLAGGIAHDFNNYLTGIIGNLSLAQLDLDPGNRMYPRLIEMEKAAMRAKDLTQQLLTFSKGGEPIKRLTQIDTVVREATLFALRGSNVRCRFDFQENLWPAHVDADQIGQVIHNLAINADQAMPEGGTVSIGGKNIDVEPDSGKELSTGRYIRITVQDRGAGIEREHIDRVFDPYFTTKPKGSGLGLTIVYSITGKHDGHVTVYSDIGVGSTFSVYLPASPGSAVKTVTSEETMISGAGRILVMDDNKIIRTLVSEMLREIGYGTALAKDGDEAIKIYRDAMASDQPFDAVILDLTIPGGMGGQETMVRLARIDKHVKAIVSSGYSNDPIMSNYRDFGFLSAVRKPYVITELSNALKKLRVAS